MKTLLGVLVPLIALAAPALAAETERYSIGGDQFVAGQEAALSGGVEHDAFAAGFNVNLTAPIAGNAHAAGYSVTIAGPVTGDVYAAGNSVTLSGAAGRDVTALGSVVSLTGTDPILGNVRAAAGTVTLTRPVSGSAMLAGTSLTLDAPISGDLLLSAETVSFGPNARVDGRVDIRSPNRIEVPASVAPADRVSFTRIEPAVVAGDAKGILAEAAGGRGGWIGAVFGALAVIVYGAILLAIFPRRAEIGLETATLKPWKSLLFGVFAAAFYVGLIPLLAASLVGIPLVPLAVVLLVLAALTGFVAGAYFLADLVLGRFGYPDDTLWTRIGALAIGLIAAWVLGIIPFVGWLVCLGFGLFGLGALSFSALGRRIDGDFHKRLAEGTLPSA